MTEVAVALKAIQLYAEMHPRPSSVSLTQGAEMLGISRETVRKMIRTGKIKTNALGQIPIVEIDRALDAKAA